MKNTVVDDLISLVQYHHTEATSFAYEESYSDSQFHTQLFQTLLDMIAYRFAPEHELLDSVIINHFSCLNAAEEKLGYAEAINYTTQAIRELRDELIKLEGGVDD